MKASKLTGCLTLVAISALLTAGVVVVARNSSRSDARLGEAAIFAREVTMPLQASAKVRQRGREMTFSQDLRDAEGKKIFVLPHRPAAPRVEVFDSTGEKIHSGKLEYG